MDGRVVGLLVGAVGGTAFVVFNAPRVPAALGLPAAALAVLALVGLVTWVVRHRHAPSGADPVDFPTAGAESRASGAGSGGGRPDARGGMYGRGYRLVVAAELVAFVVGPIVLGRFGLTLAVLPWVAFVVGVHFVALGRLWHSVSLMVVGAGVAVFGAVGFVLALAGAPDPAIATVAGIAPGVALLAGSWWAAIRPAPAADDQP